jgi:glycoprotein-N-acetylgalactosamine 3-beta-galactosyltransferase
MIFPKKVKKMKMAKKRLKIYAFLKAQHFQTIMIFVLASSTCLFHLSIKRYPPNTVNTHIEKGEKKSSDMDATIAFDEDGHPGYLHDPYYVKNHPLSFTFHEIQEENRDGSQHLADGVCDKPLGMDIEGPCGGLALRKLIVSEWKQSHPTKKVRILCLVYSHSGRHNRVVQALVETYAPRCDGWMVASNQTNRTLGTVHLSHRGPETYETIWQKVRSIWEYVYQNYLEDFEFFHIGGDNMWVIVENLHHVLSKEDPSQPLYMGAAMIPTGMHRKRYCGGGAGYTLSREALRRLMSTEWNASRCRPDAMRSIEDIAIASCLRLKVAKCHHSIDERNETRYHHYDPQFHASWNQLFPSNWGWKALQLHHNIISDQEYLNGISSTSTTFHLVRKSIYSDNGLRRYHALLYRLCGDKVKMEPLPTSEWNITCERDALI